MGRRRHGAGVFFPGCAARRRDAAARSPNQGGVLEDHPARTKRKRKPMPRKPGQNSEFVMFDVLYDDGTQRSNRKVPRALTGGIDGDKPAHGFLIEQDRAIAEKSGNPPPTIKAINRSGTKKKDRDADWKKAC
jgi:hypothetical protein